MIIPIVLSGGSGTRLWPLSRQNYPKQFLKIVNHHSLLQETLLRVKSLTNLAPPIVVCNEAHYFQCLDQAREVHTSFTNIIIEPYARNTAPAVAAACLGAMEKTGKDPLVLVLPSDHIFTDFTVFSNVIQQAQKNTADRMMLFGVPPDKPKTGYGYIKAGSTDSQGICCIEQFVEKPTLAKAQEYLAQGNYYWNSGMFLFRASVYLAELKKHAPDIYESAKLSYDCAEKNPQYVRLNHVVFEACRNESIDYAVMEKSDRCSLLPLDAGWADLGCWASVHEASDADHAGNVITGKVTSLDVSNCFLHSEDRLLAAVGLQNCVVINTKDSVLVAHKDYSEKIKSIVNVLKENYLANVLDHPKVHRPWGCYETLIESDNFKVKHIIVKSGQRLSLQLHYRRAEHWVVVAGEATVVCGEKEFLLQANESTYIPKETKHRLSNGAAQDLHIIEVQTGGYLGEDDIVRYEDIYGRRKVDLK